MTATSDKGIYYRLIALWALCEAMLGGIIHGFRLPVSGLIVGSCAVICISLIAYYHPAKGAILKATVIVAIFKMVLSPQAPLPAYFAVFFQGLLGEALFWRRKFFPLVCVLFGTLALVESGLQRIAVLTIVYGNDLWKAINQFLNGLTGQKNPSNYSFIIGAIYVLLHVVAGIIAGAWAALLPERLSKWRKKYPLALQFSNEARIQPKKRTRFKKGLFITWVILLLLYAQSEFRIGSPLLPSHISLRIFIRSLIIILTWYFILGPLLNRWLNSWLKKKQMGLQGEIQKIMDLVPLTKNSIRQSWKISENKKGISRLVLFGKMVLANSLSSAGRIFILTGKIGSGKTTSLLNWSEKTEGVQGILTPVMDGKRFFLNIQTGEKWPMEADESETKVLRVGKYVFSLESFEKAIAVIREAKNKPGWLLIDELGPLELRGEGFYEILNEILRTRKHQLLFVVRENLVDEIIKKIDLQDAEVILDVGEINEISR